MSSNDGGPPSDLLQMGTTPTLNTLLSKPSAGSDGGLQAPHPQQEQMSNGTANAERKPLPLPQPQTSMSQEWQQRPLNAPDGQIMPGAQHPGFPMGYPGHPGHPQFMPGRPGPPGMPPGFPGYPAGYPHPGQPQYPPYMMRPPGQGDHVRMPPGVNPLEWSAQQRKLTEAQGNPTTPASVPAPSPAASSVAEESNDNRLDSPSWSNPAHGQRTPIPPGGMPPGVMPPGAMPPGMHPGHPGHPGMMQSPMMQPQPMQPRRETIVDKLVGPPTAANPPRVMPERRNFFERLVQFCEQQNDPINMIPQVSKQNVDLHRLYIAVRNRGGFEQVTKDKAWKSICVEANPDISESSAAGYQLRKHYQKHLLMLECVETGKNAEEAVAFADKLKRQRKKDTPGGGQPAAGGTPTQPAAATPTPIFPPGHPGAEQSPAAAPVGFYPPPTGQPGFGPGGYPGGAPQAGYPGAFPPRMPPGLTPVRAPHPQPHMPSQSSETETPTPNTLQVPSQPTQPGTPGSQAGPASVQPPTPQTLQVDTTGSQAGSRAPSTGPPASAATPDSSSRMSAGGDMLSEVRPVSAAAPTPGSTAAPTPGATPGPDGAPHMQQPSTSMAASVQPGAPPGQYYGQPAPMYPNGPARPGPPNYPAGYPQGYHPGAPPGHPGAPQHYPPGGPHSHPAAHPAHPHHQQFLQQQQMWQQRQQYPPQGPGAMPPRGYGYPPRMAPPQGMGPQGAPSPGSQKIRSFQSTPQPPQHPQFPQQVPLRPQGPMPTTAYPQQASASIPAPVAATANPMYSHNQNFPSSSIEATVISQKRRRKIMARDLVNATPRRLIMALRSGLEMEAIWAINALNVLLYDDTNPHPSLSQMPGLLNVIIEHFWATLSVIFPETFSLTGPHRETTLSEPFSSKQVGSHTNGSDSQEVKHLVKNDKKINFTTQSRTSRKVHMKQAEMPEALKRKLMLEQSTSTESDSTLSSAFVEERVSLGLGGGLAERVAARLRAEWEASLAEPKARFSAHKTTTKTEDYINDSSFAMKEDEDDDEVPEILLQRRAKKSELADGPNEFELKWPRATALTDRDDVLYRLAMRALSLSNILRGFSFLPGCEQLLCKHNGLLYVTGRFLSLLAEEGPLQRARVAVRGELDAPLPEPESFDVLRMKALSLLDCDNHQQLLLIDTATQLRDDAFVLLCHMSAALDLSEYPECLSYPIYDGLLRWSVSSVPEATDPIPPAGTSPRNYCLEVLCKMSVLERNVDMVLSTGAWPRIEKFTHVLAKLMSMSEETHHREFAMVILKALCDASDAVAYVAAVDTYAIQNLICFIETSDQNMHSVMGSHGMPALRDNPEMMGTSVGMLRRAAGLLKVLVKAPGAYKTFLKHQQRLLQFTMSQLMDSRVAGMIADTLFYIQEVDRPDLVTPSKEIVPPTTTSIVSSTINGDSTIKKEKDDSSDFYNESLGENVSLLVKPKLNGDSSVAEIIRSGKRANSKDESPPPKRTCLENGFGEKKNGMLDKSPLQLKETRSENGSMAVVA